MALVKFQRRPTRVGFPGFGPATFPTFEDAENRMSRFMERMLNEPFGTVAFPETIGWMPAIDIVENAKELTLTAELPGIDQKDVDVSVEDGVLTVKGHKAEEHKEEKDEKVYLAECTYGSFERSFGLPATVDAAKVTAEFDKGVLKVHLPKDSVAKPRGRKVEIKAP
ncbi:MAG: Hsp20/alpha crystallin family protein [Gemmatimonadaceae bacterium]